MSENIHPDGRPEWTGQQKRGPHPFPNGTVSVELLNLERETADRIRSDNDRLHARVAELEGALRKIADRMEPGCCCHVCEVAEEARAVLNAPANALDLPCPHCGGGSLHFSPCPQPAQSPAGADWQAIETAPKDGSLFLARNKFGDVYHCRWLESEEGCDNACWWDVQSDDEACPIWWMPALPDPKPTTAENRHKPLDASIRRRPSSVL